MAIQEPQKKRPIWQDIRPVKTRPIISQAEATAKSNKKKITLPKLKKKTLIILAIVILLISITTFSVWYFLSITPTEPNNIQQTSQNNNQPNTNETPVLSKGDPEFTTILPVDKNITNFGGWTRISPESTDPVYAYNDSINDVSINISEQELPDSFKADPAGSLRSLAEGFHATQSITAGDLVIYVGTSMDGPQSVIFVKNNLLILIKSTQVISNDSWISYIESLR